MEQTEWVSVLTSVHDHRLNEPMVWDKSGMHKLNGQLGGERAGRPSPNSAQLNKELYFHAS